MVQMIQLTRGQEEILNRITAALEKIAENTTPNYDHRLQKCSEKLPEKHVVVLCFVACSDSEIYRYSLNFRTDDGWAKPEQVEYWMPVPTVIWSREECIDELTNIIENINRQKE